MPVNSFRKNNQVSLDIQSHNVVDNNNFFFFFFFSEGISTILLSISEAMAVL